MAHVNRREVLGTLSAVGGLAAAGGWIGLTADETVAQESVGKVSVGPREYKLPPLPYAPDALEPHIDAQTMTLHHDKHHAAYVDAFWNVVNWENVDARLAAAMKLTT